MQPVQDTRKQDTGVNTLTPDQQNAVDKLHELMKGPIDYYNAGRQDTEMDLLEKVRELFVLHGAGHLLADSFENNRHILEAKDKASHAQQYSLNRWLALQFMMEPKSDAISRYALIYELRPDQWLVVFKQTILPTLLELGLPRPIPTE